MSAAGYADTYDPDTDFDRHYTLATAARIRERIDPGSTLLELGCATGLMTSALADATVMTIAIDHSIEYLERARERELPGVRFLLEDLDALSIEGRFDHVLATNVLHELRDPRAFLSACRDRLAPGGSIHLTLQNPNSIHRLCALELGLIDSPKEVSERGLRWGTRTLWEAEELSELAGAAGLRTVAREGIMLKPLPNAQMAELGEAQIEGFMRVARHFPEHCAINYLVLACD